MERKKHMHTVALTHSHIPTAHERLESHASQNHTHIFSHIAVINRHEYRGTELELFLMTEYSGSKPNMGLKYVIELSRRDIRDGKLTQTGKRVYCHRQKSW